jgi:D-sedoheptulose 7-phosphate isomerase
MSVVVFTNGCFDLLHPGHIDLLERARALGDRLFVGINSDISVRSIKGDGRPIMNQDDRKAVLESLRSVDEVIIFDELTPEKLIRDLKPDILVKGGDWKPNEIIGSEFVLANGGEVKSLPLLGEYSTSRIVDRLDGKRETIPANPVDSDGLALPFAEHIEVFNALLGGHLESIQICAEIIINTFRSGKKLLICGNGGSAADAQHLAAEFVGRYEKERRGLPAIALTTDTSALTALANDYDFERIFARQVEALAVEGDCLIAISTSGNSPNIIAAIMAARQRGCRVVGLTGSGGKKLAGLCDAVVMVPSQRTARIQEVHIAIAHYWCELLDERLSEETL